MPVLDLGEGFELRHLFVAGIKPKDPGAYMEAIKAISSFPGVSAQLLDAKSVAGQEHIVSAALLAVRAWSEKRNTSRTPATEVLLYASGKRQIKEAIAGFGVTAHSKGWVVIALSNSLSKIVALSNKLGKIGTPDNTLLELTGDKIATVIEKFGISKEEISTIEPLFGSTVKALQALVMEKVAISEVYR
jgi:KEOPS complex subunit Cgi121